MARTVKVVKNPEQPEPTAVIAEAILAISEGVKRLRASRLNDRALVLLIQHACPSVGKFNQKPVSAKEVRSVLDGIESLEREYLKPRKPL